MKQRRSERDGQYMRELGARIREARERRGMNQAQARRAIGFGPGALLSQYERGRTMPSALNLKRIAQGLDVSPRWLLSGPKTELK